MHTRIYQTLNNKKLWDWFSIHITTKDGSKFVKLKSKLHKGDGVDITWSYNAHAYPDYAILKDHDLIRVMFECYGDPYAEKQSNERNTY